MFYAYRREIALFTENIYFRKYKWLGRYLDNGFNYKLFGLSDGGIGLPGM